MSTALRLFLSVLLCMLFALLIMVPADTARSSVFPVEWSTFTNTDDILSLAIDGDWIWYGTTGGLVKWNISSQAHTVFTREDGLPENRVQDVQIDSDGTVWYGTRYGAGCFDGVEWRNYSVADGMSGNVVNEIAIGPDHDVWVATTEGVCRFDGSSWQAFSEADSLPVKNYVSIAVDTLGIAWAATEQPLKYQPSFVKKYEDGQWQTVRYSENRISWFAIRIGEDNIARAIQKDGSGAYLLGVVLDESAEKHATGIPAPPNASGIESEPVLASVDYADFTYYPDGSLFAVGSGQADDQHYPVINVKAVRDFACQNLPATPGEVSFTDVVFDADGFPWMSSNKGLYTYHQDTHSFFRYTVPGLPHTTVLQMDADEQGVVWLGTPNGVGTYDGSSFETHDDIYDILSYRSQVLTVDANDVPWVSTEHRVYGYDGEEWAPAAAPGDTLTGITAILSTRDHSTWFFSDRACREHYGDWTVYDSGSGFPEGFTAYCAVEHNNMIVAGGNGGLAVFDGTNWGQYVVDESNPIAGYFTDIVVYDDALWMTSLTGIACFKDSVFTFVDSGEAGIDGVLVNSIASDDNDVLWVGGPFSGLISYDGQEWATFSIADGLNDTSINDIMALDTTIWIATDEGVSVLEYKLDDVAVEEPDTPELLPLRNHPNPFNPTTTITYQLASRGKAALSVYSVTGQLVRSYDLGLMQPGAHSFVFDGAGLSSGVYLYRLEAGQTVQSGRMLLMK